MVVPPVGLTSHVDFGVPGSSFSHTITIGLVQGVDASTDGDVVADGEVVADGDEDADADGDGDDGVAAAAAVAAFC